VRSALLQAIATGLLFTAAVGVWNTLIAQLWLALGTSPESAGLGTKLIALALFGSWIAYERQRPELGVSRPTNSRAVWSIVPLVAFVFALNFEQAMFVHVAPVFVAGALVSASWEEFAFRGVLMGLLSRYGAAASAWISSLGFGLLHAVQPDLQTAVLSVFLTTGLGLSLAALRLGTGSLWPPLVAHGIINASASAAVGAHPAAQSPALWVPLLLGTYFLAYGAFLLSLLPPEAAADEDG